MRRGAMQFAVLATALLAAVSPALARQFTDDEKQQLATAVQAFDTAMRASDFEAVVNASISPKLMASMASSYNVPAEQLKTLVIQQMQQAVQTVKIDSFGMDIDHIDYQETTDGTPYALLPSEVVMEVAGTKTKSSGPTLAFLDDGNWYLLNVGQKTQVDVLKSAYASFADVTFPEAKMEAVQ